MPLEPPAWAEKKYATVAALVRGECANHRPSKVEPTPELCIDRDEPCCLLADEPEPCPWFERCLLPAVPTLEGRKPVAEDYLRMFPGNAAALRVLAAGHAQWSARQCECGAPLRKRQRVCPKCRRAGRRHSRSSHTSQLTVQDVP